MIAPARWQQVRALFHRALELPPDERSGFVRQESAGDEEICREVESLLAAYAGAEGFLDSPRFTQQYDGQPSPPSFRFAAGTRLGSFEILGSLGAGGMGEVYRARDTRLDRTVALKVLAPDLAADPRSRERFEREARVISRLTHPHICTLYDIGSAEIDGRPVQFLVM